MRRKLIPGLPILLLLLTAIYSCGGDDDCPTCPSPVPKALMWAMATLEDNHLQLSATISAMENSLSSIDSMTLSGRKVGLEKRLSLSGEYLQADFDQAAFDIESGDTVVLDIFTSYGRSTGSVVALDRNADKADIIDWRTIHPYDTVSTGSEIVVSWHKAEAVEWYLVSTGYQYSSGRYSTNEYTTDTTLTIPATETQYDGVYTIIICSGTGPDYTTDSFNITGALVQGTLRSGAFMYFSIIVGSGLDMLSGCPWKFEPASDTLSPLMTGNQSDPRRERR